MLEQVRETEAVFTQPRASNSGDSISMDNDRVEQIRSAMSAFQLPPSAIPNWASELSDEEWRKMLSEKLSLEPKK